MKQALIVFTIVICAGLAPAQDFTVAVDWSGPSLQSAPLYINQKTPVAVHITNINDGLYTYVVTVSAKPREIDDASKIIDLMTPSVGLAASCPQAALDDLGTKIKSFENNKGLYPFKDGKLVSIAWSDTAAAFDSEHASQYLSEYENCKSLNPQAVSQIKDSDLWNNRLQRIVVAKTLKHEIVQQTTFEPEVDYDISVTEKYEAQVVKTFNVPTVKPVSNLFTLSAGTLLSQVQNRTYSQTGSGAAQGSFLRVDGTGTFSPDLVALLNYRFPRYLSGDNFGLALSSGAVLSVTGSDVSKLGFFGGISMYFWNRFYVTPGAHVGQFADTPFGFSIGQPIPTGFGSIVPQKRYTARFALAITYRAKDFSSFSKPSKSATNTSNGATTSGKPSTTPGNPPASKPGKSNNP